MVDLMSDRKLWGFAVALGPVIRRRFPGTADEASRQAQLYANQRNVDVDFWDENDRSAAPGKRADSLRTVGPKIVKIADLGGTVTKE